MRYLAIIIISLFLFASCNSTPERPEAVMTAEQNARVAAESASIAAQKASQAAIASAAGSGLPHYYCTTHPTNGADAAGSCSICGNALTHNQAYHNAPNESTAPGANGAVTPPVEPTLNAAGVFHYTCPNGHSGGGGGATPCAECGTTLVHNTAYHNTPSTTTAVNPTDATGALTPPAPAVEPAVNAAGVYHYTCPNGHSGGGGGATPCGECGTTLVHNAGYH